MSLVAGEVKKMLQLASKLMGYGSYLKRIRTDAGLSQDKLAEIVSSHGHTVSGANISMIEREYDRTKSGMPTRPKKEFVILAAKACGVDPDEALVAADYAPSYATKPRNVGELLTRLEKLGLEHLEFDTEPSDFSPEQLQEVYDAITIAIELTLRKKR